MQFAGGEGLAAKTERQNMLAEVVTPATVPGAPEAPEVGADDVLRWNAPDTGGAALCEYRIFARTSPQAHAPQVGAVLGARHWPLETNGALELESAAGPPPPAAGPEDSALLRAGTTA